MREIFKDRAYSSDGRTEVERDADLAMHIVMHLSDCQDAVEGCWHGQHLVATLRNTCHILEALYSLERHAFEGMIDSGISWLVNLSDNLNDDGEDVHSLRLHPSRFKTLAWLGTLDDTQVQSELERLGSQISDTGLLHGFTARPLLATMTLLDCFYHIDRREKLNRSQKQQAELALDAVQRQLESWQPGSYMPDSESLSTAGDVSYALDLLVRWGRMRTSDPRCTQVVPFLLAQIERSQRRQPVSSDMLYSIMQLANHFNTDVEIHQQLCQFLQSIRVHYDRPDLRKQPEVIHPLVLRCLLAVHGEALRAKMIGNLLRNQLELLQEHNQTNDLELRRAFQELIKRRLDVDIQSIQPLSGGITNNEVFRVAYAINLTSPYQIGDLSRTQFPGPQSLVIKQGSRDSLNRAVTRYQRLPESVKEIFARHADDPQLLATDPTTPAYLILEDLTDRYDTFRNMLNQADQRRLTMAQRDALHHACATIMKGLTAIYESTKTKDTDFVSHQLARLYLSGIEHQANKITQTGRHAHFRVWVRGFWLGKRRFPSLDHYLQIIERHRTKISIPFLMLIHGDCHARNIMLDSDYDHVKLIDLDKLDYEGDYIWDVAELLEDVAVFRFLFDEEYRFYYDGHAVTFPVSDSPNPNPIEARIEYPAFTSALTQEFQHTIIELLQDYAERIGDTSWKDRLWLALASHLLSLVSNHDSVEHASVIYVEAMKMLDDLCAHLQQKIPLPDIPFPGTHVDPESRERREPFQGRGQEKLLILHRKIVAMSDGIDYEARANGSFARYFRPDVKWPVVLVDTTKKQWQVLLAANCAELSDPNGLAEPTDGGGALGTVITLDKEFDPAAVAELIKQTVV